MLADEAEKNLIRLMEEVVDEGKAALGWTNLREDVEGRWSWEKAEEKVVRRGVSREAIFSCQGKAVSVALGIGSWVRVSLGYTGVWL
jgi:hypothetical protein